MESTTTREALEYTQQSLAEVPDSASIEKASGQEKIADKLLKGAFLEALGKFGTVTRAREEIGRLYGVMPTRLRIGRWVKKDAKFRARYVAACEEFADRLEDAAIERGVHGWEEPVYWKGEVQGSIRRYDGSLLQMLIKGSRPQKYRDVVGVQHQTAAEMREALNKELARLSLLPPKSEVVDAEVVGPDAPTE